MNPWKPYNKEEIHPHKAYWLWYTDGTKSKVPVWGHFFERLTAECSVIDKVRED